MSLLMPRTFNSSPAASPPDVRFARASKSSRSPAETVALSPLTEAPPVDSSPPNPSTHLASTHPASTLREADEFPQANPTKKALGVAISAVTLFLSLFSMGVVSIPKVPLFSLPFFGMVILAFAVKEALIAVADRLQIPTIHHEESLHKLLNCPARMVSDQVLQKLPAIVYGGAKDKQETIAQFETLAKGLTEQVTRGMVQNPLFDDLNESLKNKHSFGEKAEEIGKAGGKVLLTLAAASFIPKPLRLTITPWLSQAIGYPVLNRIWQQIEAKETTSPPGAKKSRRSSAGDTAGKTAVASKTKPVSVTL
jgi:hypothetical protein